MLTNSDERSRVIDMMAYWTSHYLSAAPFRPIRYTVNKI